MLIRIRPYLGTLDLEEVKKAFYKQGFEEGQKHPKHEAQPAGEILGNEIEHVAEAICRIHWPTQFRSIMDEHGGRRENYINSAKAAIAVMTSKREIGYLEKENFALAADQCHHGYAGEYGHHRCKYQDEIARLQNALSEICDGKGYGHEGAKSIAFQVLEDTTKAPEIDVREIIGEWHPISTVPQDVSMGDLFVALFNNRGDCLWVKIIRNPVYITKMMSLPSHWMVIPALNSIEDGESK